MVAGLLIINVGNPTKNPELRMFEGARLVTIGSLGRVITGTTPSTKRQDYWGDDYPFVTPTEMQEGNRVPMKGRGTTALARSDMSSRYCPSRATAVCCIGSIGKVVMLAEESLCNQQINTIVVDRSRHDERFVYYLMTTQRDRLRSVASGSATPLLNKSAFSALEVMVPPLPEQRAIAEVLGALDDKIESNRRVVEKLDAIAQLTYLVSESDSWVEMTLRDCVELLPGKYLSKDEYGALGTYPVFGSNSRMGRGPRFLYEGPVIAMARIGSNFGGVMWSTESAWINNNASGVRALPGFDLKHIFYWLRAFDFESIRRGSGQPFVAHEDLYAQVIRLPQEEERQRISESVSAMFHIIDQRERENLLLESARDTLLPALLSGRIRVPAAAALVEAS